MEQLKSSSKTQSGVSFYRVVVKNARLRELWRLTKPNLFEFAMGGFVKLFRIDLPVTHGFAANDLLKMNVGEVPEEIIAEFAKEQQELSDLGFSESFAFSIPVLGSGEMFALVFVHQSEDRIAGLLHHRLVHNDVVELQRGIAISSRTLSERHIYTTTNLAKSLDPPLGECRLEVVNLSSVSKINAHHSRRLESCNEKCESLTGDRVWQLLVDCHNLEIADQLSRGVINEMTSDEMLAVSSI